MKIENQVCALDQAKKLKELGINQLAALWHFAIDGKGKVAAMVLLTEKGRFTNPENGAWYSDWTKIAAFTSAELGEMLGSEFQTELEPGELMHVWHCRSDINYEVAFPADTEAEAKADMLIWLLEKGHRTAAEANAALAAV